MQRAPTEFHAMRVVPAQRALDERWPRRLQLLRFCFASGGSLLRAAVLAVRDGCRISTFALIEDYWGMDWVSFVDQLTRLTKGVAFYTSSGELASCIMESYLSGRKKKAYLA